MRLHINFAALVLALLHTTANAVFKPANKGELQAAVDACLAVSPVGDCSTTTYGPMGAWDVSAATDMSSLFRGATLFNADISNWDTSAVTNMAIMFYQAKSFNGDVSNWDVPSVTNMENMFGYASSFNGDISKWDVSAVTSTVYMFRSANSFNGDISKWDVSSVRTLSFTFYNANSFAHTLYGTWCTSTAPKTSMFHNSPGKIGICTTTTTTRTVETTTTTATTTPSTCTETTYEKMGNGVCVDANGAQLFRYEKDTYSAAECQAICDQHDECEGWQTEQSLWCSILVSKEIPNFTWPLTSRSTGQGTNVHGSGRGVLGQAVFGSDPNVQPFWKCYKKKKQPCTTTTAATTTKKPTTTTPSTCTETTYEKMGNGVCVDANGAQLFRYEKDTYSAAECQAICDQHDECEGWQTEQSLWCSILVSKEIPNFTWPVTSRSTGQGTNVHGPGRGVLGQAVFGSDPNVQSFWKCYKKKKQPCTTTTVATTTKKPTTTTKTTTNTPATKPTSTTTTTAAKACKTHKGNGFWGVPAGARSSHGRRSVEQCRTLCETSASCVGFNVVGATTSDTSLGRCDTLSALGQWRALAGNTQPAFTCKGGDTPKTCYCVGDPHCASFAGVTFDNHDIGWKTLYQKGDLKIEAEQALWQGRAAANWAYRVTYRDASGNVVVKHGELGQVPPNNGVMDFASPAVKLTVQAVDFSRPRGAGDRFVYNIFVTTTETDGAQGVCAGHRRRRLDEFIPPFPANPVVTEKEAEAACGDLKAQFDNCVFDVRMTNDPDLIDVLAKSFKVVEETVERLAHDKTAPAPATTSTSFRGAVVSAGTVEMISAVVTCLVAAAI